MTRKNSTTTFGTWLADDEEPVIDRAEPSFVSRYEDRGSIGRGGMGEVRRVYDRQLEREVAMKLVLPERMHPKALDRFRREARIHADLQHPGIVPVHDAGVLPDGRLFFTMREIQGRTLRKAISQGLGQTALLGVYRQACLTVAYAHERGVIHRDLKPSNIMLGAFGEVLILDWGIAIESGKSGGGVSGTPRYMAPEQADPDRHPITAATDVYGLGGILYHILSGEPPFAEIDDARQQIAILAGGGRPGPLASGGRVSEALVSICERAMAPDPPDRFADAHGLAQEIGRWMDGEVRRERARAVARASREAMVEAKARGQAATEKARDALGLRRSLDPDADLDARRQLWQLEDDGKRLEQQAEVREAAGLALLRAALSHDPDLEEAHADLAVHYHRLHREAEAGRDEGRAAALEVHLREHDRAGVYAPYLRGDARLSLVTEPPGAEVHLYRMVRRDRRYEAVSEGVIGVTPIQEVPLSRGSWLCEVQAPGHLPVRYPIHLDRLEHWDGVPPGEAVAHPVVLPRKGALGPDDCYVPAGWAWLGGGDLDDREGGTPLSRVWCEAFVMRRHPVTNAEYLDFLDALLRSGGEEAAAAHVPREGESGAGAAVFGVQDGRFAILPDGDGDLWDPRWPVIHVDWHSAFAFAQHQGWRLPTEWERERAARGADGRRFPWGDTPEALFARCRHSSGPMGPAVVGSSPWDRSVYGIEGLGGNVLEWCRSELHRGALPARLVVGEPALAKAAFRGGSWNNLPARNAADQRYHNKRSWRHATLSFRLARSL